MTKEQAIKEALKNAQKLSGAVEALFVALTAAEKGNDNLVSTFSERTKDAMLPLLNSLKELERN